MTEPGEPVALLDRVAFWYPGRADMAPVREDVNLTLERNDFLGLVGPNGGGKTTLLKLLLGLLRPSRGTVRGCGQEPDRARRRIGYVPQHAAIDPSVPASVLDVVLMGALADGPWGMRFSPAARERARSALAEVGMDALAERGIGTLSGGQVQRVLLARALVAEVELLLLDEPTSGVDLHMEQTIFELLGRLNRRLPIVLVSHDVAFVSSQVKRVACLNRRLAFHPLEEVGCDLIRSLYGPGGMSAVQHGADCPLPGAGEGRG